MTEQSVSPAPAATRNRRGRRRFPWYAYISLLPIAVVLVAFQYYPAISGMIYSFFDWNPAGSSPFIGFENYARMMSDELWWLSFRNLGAIFAFSIVAWVLPLLAAELVSSVRSQRAQFIYRTLLILPMAFPGIVTALIWAFMYQPNRGLFNEALKSIGLGALARNWVGDPSLALIALLFIGFPFIAGLPFLIFYTSLQNIPKEVFEAADLDGVGRVRRVWTIDLPLMMTQLKLLVFLAVVGTVQYGFVAYVVTGGGPDNVTLVPLLRMFAVAFQAQDWGYAAALSTTLFLITLVLSCVIVFVKRKSDTSDVRGM
ncbi:carbohydrate ABC transporter permease [Cryobacterium soli]|uniref:carbohydrate ABC transporter permease n=1 Tax=Cryobacterium soli TaxID=2220095 RepID=UPI000E725272|nr:sugar ABC transporter permease [Cryobacterium soli]